MNVKKIKKILVFLIQLFIMLPATIFALDIDDYNVISSSEKYYKTVIFQSSSYNTNIHSNYQSYTIEINKKEYDKVDTSIISNWSSNGVVETTYKKMTTTISTNGTYFRYKTILNWKNIPKVKSYDTIAIGHYASVTQKGNLYFTQEYCLSATNCKTSNTFTQQKFSKGASATFKLPNDSLISLKQTLYFDVKKNVDATIIKQIACGDYSHATKSISPTDALNFSVNDSGIILNTSISNYYDEINSACATWNGSW